MSKSFKACGKIQFGKDYFMNNGFGETKKILSTDIGIITANGNVVVQTGELKGKILPASIGDFEIEGVDTEVLSVLVLEKLKNTLPRFSEYLDENKVKEDDLLDNLWDILSDYL